MPAAERTRATIIQRLSQNHNVRAGIELTILQSGTDYTNQKATAIHTRVRCIYTQTHVQADTRMHILKECYLLQTSF